MADALAQAAAGQGDNRRAVLDAMARGGRAGRAAYQQGQQSIRGAQSDAMAGGAADAFGLFSSGTPVESDNAALASGGYAPYEQALGRLSSAFQTNMDRQGQLNSEYFGQAAAAAPAYRAQADEQIQEARDRWLAQKAEYDAQQQAAGGDSMPQWKIVANATGLGEQMAGDATQQSRQSMADAINEALAAGRARGERGEGPTFDEYQRAAETNEATGAGWTGEGQAPVRRAQRDAVQTVQTPEWAWQRAAADAMGVSEPLAAGLFQPPDPGELVDDAQDQRQYGFLTGPGQGMFESPQAMRDYQTAEQDLMVPADPVPFESAAAGLGMDPTQASELATHPAFAQVVSGFQAGLDAGYPIETINAIVAQTLAGGEFGHDFPQMRELATMMYGHMAG